MSRVTGLTAEDVKEQQKKGLVNGNFSVKTKSIWQIIFTNVFTLFNFVNLFLALCLFLVHSYKNMMFLGVVFWNVLIGVVQEVRSKRVIDKLSLLSAPHAVVIRDGKEEQIKLEDIVLNDVILLKNGNQVCVDSCILEGECEVNESLLTGESEPVYKKAGDEILSGSYLVSGNVVTKAIHVGKENYVNIITGRAKYLKRPNSEILRSVKLIIRGVSIALLPIGILLFLNRPVEQSFQDAVVSTVAGILGMIPSGLVLLTSMVLAVSVVRLGKKNTLVQEMYCIETLARVDTLCLDKTGTITEGTMSVEEIIHLAEGEKAKEELYTMVRDFTENLEDDNPTFNALCSYMRLSENGDGPRRRKNVRTAIGFSSDKKWSLLSLEGEGTYVMGAMEFMFEHPDGELKALVDRYSEEGHRVLVFAHAKFTDEYPQGRQLPADLEAKGIILLSDTIRREAPDTFRYFINQGVRIKVISGDNPKTVSYVASKAGVPGADKYIDATLLVSDEELKEAAETYTVFGRVTPNQKLKLVKALKENGHTVAMTGDGVNDCMALKEADCSIAMQSGSDAARNVSQLVLMDSNFASMPAIVAEGRRTINNLQRSASLYLTKTIYSTILAILFVILPSAYPFIPIQLTFIGSLSIGIPSFILALEPNVNRVKGSFIINVLKLAIPGAAMVVTNVAAVWVFKTIFNVSRESFSTLCLYGLAIAALLQLMKCCKPFNRLRQFMCIGLIGLFIFGTTFFKGLLGLERMSILQGIFMSAMIVVSTVLYVTYSKMTGKIMGSMPNIYEVYLFYSDRTKIVLVEDDVERKDYYDVTAQMKSLKMLGADSVAYIKKPLCGGEIRVETAARESDMTIMAAAARYYLKKHRRDMEGKKVLVETDVTEAPAEMDLAAIEPKIRYIKKFRITF